MPTVGICRSLHAYTDYNEWAGLLGALDCEVRLSPPTSRRDLDLGVRMAPAELCLPVKAFLGQVAAFAPEVDFVLLPRIVCRMIDRHPFFGCPKSLALPDLVRALLPQISNGIELLIDERKQTIQESFLTIAKHFSYSRRRALEAWRHYYESGGQDIHGAREVTRSWSFWSESASEGERRCFPALPDKGRPRGMVVGVVGHPYLVLDKLLSLNLLDRLRQLGTTVLLPEFDGYTVLNSESRPESDEGGKMLWRDGCPDWLYELALLRGAAKFVCDPAVDGLLLVSSFACGTAAVVNELIRRAVAGLRSLPILILLLDEHTGAAGLATRLESFVDILARNHGRGAILDSRMGR